MGQSKRMWLLNEFGMARARALNTAIGYDSEVRRRLRIGVANTYSENQSRSFAPPGGEAVQAGIWQEELEVRGRAWSRPPPCATRWFLTLYPPLAEPAERGAGFPVRLAQREPGSYQPR